MEHFDLIQKYLKNQLEGEALISFNKKLKTDTAFQKEFHDYKKIINGFTSLKAEAFENQLKEWATEEHTNNNDKPKSNEEVGKTAKMRQLKKVAIGSVAVFLVLFLGWKFLSPSKDTNQQIAQFSKDQTKLVSPDLALLKESIIGAERGSSDNLSPSISSQQLAQGINFFQSNKFQECIYKSNTIDEFSSLSQYLGAYCLFKNNEFENAALAFQQLLASKGFDKKLDKNEVGWMVIFSKLKSYGSELKVENKNEIKKMLEDFIQKANQDFPKYIKKAKALQSILN